jgi:hypothetical protein
LVGWKNSLFNEPLSTEHSRVREFMRLKYKERRWYKPYTGPIQRPKPVEDEEEEVCGKDVSGFVDGHLQVF